MPSQVRSCPATQSVTRRRPPRSSISGAPLAWPVPRTSGPDRQWPAECSGAALRETLRAAAPEVGGDAVAVPAPAGEQAPLRHSGCVPAGDRFFVKFAWSHPAALRLAREISVL